MPETFSSSSHATVRARSVGLWFLIAVLVLTTVAGWWVAWDARRQLGRARHAGPAPGCDERGTPDPRAVPVPTDAPGTDAAATAGKSPAPADPLDACLRDPRVQAHLDRRLREASRLGAIAGSDATRRAEIEKAMKRRYDALERRERADRAALARLAQERHLDDATRARLGEALQRQNDDETESFLQFKEGRITDKDHFADIQSGTARVHEAFTSLIGADGLALYKKLWDAEFKKELEKLDQEEGFQAPPPPRVSGCPKVLCSDVPDVVCRSGECQFQRGANP